MSANAGREYGSTLLLIALGLLPLYGGPAYLMIALPAALAVWYVAARITLKNRGSKA